MSTTPAPRLNVITGDITTLKVDVIVNAANRSLLGGGGVDGAIHRAAGPELKAATQRLRETDWPDGLPVGQVTLTDGFSLPARYVIHTVGPVYAEDEDKSELLADCYRNALRLAADKGCGSIAFPAISTGVYGYPFDQAAQVVLSVMRDELPKHPALEVTLCFFSEQGAEAFRQIAGSAS